MDGNKTRNQDSGVDLAGSPGHRALEQSDEIDLVDLWLFFWDQRKTFLSSALLIAVVGIVGFSLVYDPKPVSIVHSIIEAQSVVVDGKIVATLSADTLVKRLEYVDLPRLASQPEYKQIKPVILATKAVPVNGTNMVEITSETPDSAIGDVAKFQGELIEAIRSELEDSPYSLSGDISDRIYSLNSTVISLQRLISELDRELGIGAESQDLSGQSLWNQLDQRKNHMTTELGSLSRDLEYLESALLIVEPRILVRGQVSSKTGGIQSSTAYSLIIVMALFSAIFIVVAAAFVSKVQARMAERA